MPRRTSVGTDYNRVNLLMAVIEKRAGLRLSECDAYINIAGGIKVNEPALDLGIVLAIISSYRDKIIPSDTIAFGEVGLSGEVRAISQVQQRITEAAKMGFTRCIIPYANMEKLGKTGDIKVIGVRNIGEVMNLS